MVLLHGLSTEKTLSDFCYMLSLKAGNRQLVRTGLTAAICFGKCTRPIRAAASDLLHVH